jgi:Raf kinase inhibitor-like YbhB/YbcL family protein
MKREETTVAIVPSRLSRGLLLAAVLASALTALACEESEATKEESVMTFALTSAAFKNNDRIPVKYTGEGADVSPPLEWGDPPANTKAFALICDDPDAPVGTWDHWVMWNIPAVSRQLPENVAKTDRPADPPGAVQGRNSWPKTGYNGPMPPKGHGTHHYNFALYALDAALDLKPGATKKELLMAMKGHVLGQAKITGTYSR